MMSDAPKIATQGIAPKRLSLGSWMILVVLLALFGATMFVAYLGWRLGDDADVPITGYVAMAMGVILSLAVGFGLMALVFFSSRRGYDAPPRSSDRSTAIPTSKIEASPQREPYDVNERV